MLEICILDVDECSIWGNQCPQICRNVKGSYKCKCNDGFSDVKGKGTKCKAEGNSKVTFIHLLYIYIYYIL